VFPETLPGEMKYDCNKDVFYMKFACVFKISSYVLLSCPQYVINADTVMEINSLICFKNRVHSPDENVLKCFFL
jgi:hypothetical protein